MNKAAVLQTPLLLSDRIPAVCNSPSLSMNDVDSTEWLKGNVGMSPTEKKVNVIDSFKTIPQIRLSPPQSEHRNSFSITRCLNTTVVEEKILQLEKIRAMRKLLEDRLLNEQEYAKNDTGMYDTCNIMCVTFVTCDVIVAGSVTS